MKLESKIQAERIKQLELEGYYVIRLMATNKNGIPDLIAIPKDSNVLFSEIKRPGEEPSELQKFRIKELLNHGSRVEIFNGRSSLCSKSEGGDAGDEGRNSGSSTSTSLF